MTEEASPTFPKRSFTPDKKRIASATEVFPELPCPTNPTFLISWESYCFIAGLSKKYKSRASIVNIGSIVGEIGFNDLSGYASTKGALKSLTKSFSVEKAKFGIRSNLINPGFIKTSYYKKFKKNKRLYNWTLSRIPLNRWGDSSEISNLICFLISDNSSYINGETINIDGGWLNG